MSNTPEGCTHDCGSCGQNCGERKQDPQSFLELCSMSDDDLKYERARFLKHLSGS